MWLVSWWQWLSLLCSSSIYCVCVQMHACMIIIHTTLHWWLLIPYIILGLPLNTVGRQETGGLAVGHVEEVSRPGRCAAWGKWPTRGKRWWRTPSALSSLQPRSSPATPRPAHPSGAPDPGHKWVHLLTHGVTQYRVEILDKIHFIIFLLKNTKEKKTSHNHNLYDVWCAWLLP